MTAVLIRPDDPAGPAPARPPAGAADERLAKDGGLLGRARVAIVCLGFLAMTLAQQPGRIVPDTKLDLAVDPWALLARGLRMWDPQGFAGQVQNQVYGYLFPMGPFFGLGQAVGLPAWVVQRLWMAVLLSAAFLGVLALARRLPIGTPGAQLLAALAYALAPRMLTGLGATSVEVLPMALAPWVLVPLVTGARGGSPRRAAALSGLAVFCIGGVNAVATAAVLPLAALWLLTRPAGPRRRRLLGWWAGSVVLATAWWAGPLLLLGRYSPPFLDYIESARVTTSVTGPFSTLRGTTQWLAYIGSPSGPLWPAGWALIHEPLLLVATAVLTAAGVLGLTRRGLPERTWLVLGVITGVALVAAAHVGTVQGSFAEHLRDLLDGPLAPMRNVHKFDPVLRLPLTLGLAHLGGLVARRARRGGLVRLAGMGIPARIWARGALVVVVACLVATASPALAGRLAPPTGFEAVPGYWRQAADWLAADRPSGRALLVPASSFGTYVWGNPADEPLQPLAGSPWEVRNAVPLTPPAHIRMLDAIEQRLARGEGSAGLTGALARAGISHLVVRNDLDFGNVGATRPALVQQALRSSPGIRRVATFGPIFPAENELFGRFLDAGLTPQRRAVEIFSVADPAPRAYTTPLADAVTVLGGPDGVVSLEEHGLLGDRPAFLPETAGAAGRRTTLVSDAQRRRERSFGRITGGSSATLAADDPLRLDAPARDYLYPGWQLGESVVRVDGARITASSSASDPDSFGGADPAAAPFAAIDGDLSTAWRPANRLGSTPASWWRIDSARLLSTTRIKVFLADHGQSRPPALLRITTDRGHVTVAPADSAQPQWFPLPPGTTHSITIAAEPSADDGSSGSFGLAEVGVPGLSFSRTVVTPSSGGAVEGFAFDASNPATSGCVTDRDGHPLCDAAVASGAEEPRAIDREFTAGSGARYDVSVTAVPRPGAALDRLIDRTGRPLGPSVSVSSATAPDPRAGADALVDGDPATVWRAATDDPHPTVTLRWLGRRSIDRLRVVLPPGTPGSRPMALTLTDDGGLERTIGLAADGTAEFSPIRTTRLTVSFLFVDERRSFDPYSRTVAPLGVAIGELQLPGLSAPDPATVVAVRCGAGPTVAVDGVVHRTSVRTTLGGLRSLQPIEVTLCDGGATTDLLAAGTHRFVARGTTAFAITSATLRRSGAEPPVTARTPATLLRWDAEHRVLALPARTEPTLLVVPENANPGWQATVGGDRLPSRTVDGWQQGYVVPAGSAAEVHLDYAPGAAYRAALLAGAGAVAVLIGLLLIPVRRPGPPATGRRRRAGALVGLVLLAGLVLVSGVLGLAVLAALLAIRWGARAPSPVLGVMGAVALVAGGVAVALLPGGTGDSVAQVLAVVALAALVASVLPDRAAVVRSGTRVRNRLSGRSTSR